MDDLCRGRYSERGEAKGNVKCEMRVNASGKELGCARLVLSLATGDAVVGIGYEKKRNSEPAGAPMTPRESFFVSPRPPTTRTYERRHLFGGPCRVR